MTTQQRKKALKQKTIHRSSSFRAIATSNHHGKGQKRTKLLNFRGNCALATASVFEYVFFLVLVLWHIKNGNDNKSSTFKLAKQLQQSEDYSTTKKRSTSLATFSPFHSSTGKDSLSSSTKERNYYLVANCCTDWQ